MTYPYTTPTGLDLSGDVIGPDVAPLPIVIGRALDRRNAITAELADLDAFFRVVERLGIEPQPHPLPAAQTGPARPSSAVTTPASVESEAAGAESKAAPASDLPDGASEEGGGFPVAAAPHESGATGGDEGDQTSQPANVGGTPDATVGRDRQPHPEKADVLPPAAEVAPPPATSAAPTTRQRVKALHDAHPEFTRRQAWEYLGITEGSLAGHGYALKIKWAPAAPEKPASALAPDPGTSHAEPQRSPPAPAAEPAAGKGGVIVTKAPVYPKGQRFYLRDDDGLFLHQSVTRGRDGKPLMTSERVYAWCDIEARLIAVRRVLPETMSFRVEPEKKQQRAAA